MQNGRKRGCNSCGQSESNESLEFIGVQPHDSSPITFHSKVSGARYDIQALLLVSSFLMDEKLATGGSMEKVGIKTVGLVHIL